MTRKTGRVLFIIFFFIFIIIGVGAVFYSLGYRIDLSNFKIQKTGAIYIKTQPRNVIIKINNKIYPDQSNILQGGTLIQNLLPKTYKVEIDKDGYAPYYKNLKVEQSVVAEIVHVLLIPNKINAVPVISIRGNTFIDSADNSNKFIFQNKTTGIFYLYNLNDPLKALNLNSLYSSVKKSSKINRVSFVPFNSQNLVVEDQSGLKILNLDHLTTTVITKNPPYVWNIENSIVYFIKNSDDVKNHNLILSSYNLIFQSENQLAEIPQSILSNKKFKEIKTSGGNDKIAFLDSDNNLFLFNQSSNEIKKISSNIKDFDFAPSNDQMAYLNLDGKLNILFFKDFDGEIIKKTGDIVSFNLENKENITGINWFKDSFHIFIKYTDETKIMEINDLPPLNTIKIISGAYQSYYDFKNNILFLADNGQLQKIDFNSF